MGAAGTASSSITTTAGTDSVAGTAYSMDIAITAAAGNESDISNGDLYRIEYNDSNNVPHIFNITVASSADHANGYVTAAEINAAGNGTGLYSVISDLSSAGYADAQAFTNTFKMHATAAQFQAEAFAADKDIAISYFIGQFANSSYHPMEFSYTGVVDGVDSVTAAGAETEVDFGTKTGTDVIGSTLSIGGKTYEFVKTGEAVKTAGNVAVSLAESDTSTAIASALATSVKLTLFSMTRVRQASIMSLLPAAGSRLPTTQPALPQLPQRLLRAAAREMDLLFRSVIRTTATTR